MKDLPFDETIKVELEQTPFGAEQDAFDSKMWTHYQTNGQKECGDITCTYCLTLADLFREEEEAANEASVTSIAPGTPMSIQEIARNWDLTDTPDQTFLNALSLENLQIFKKILIERAAAVIGEIGELRSTEEFERGQYARKMFCADLEDDSGKKVFEYSCEPRFADRNMFAPGAWFSEYLNELDELRQRKQENTETFEERAKNKLVSELCAAL